MKHDDTDKHFQMTPCIDQSKRKPETLDMPQHFHWMIFTDKAFEDLVF
jgi:hypothetical protein